MLFALILSSLFSIAADVQSPAPGTEDWLTYTGALGFFEVQSTGEPVRSFHRSAPRLDGDEVIHARIEIEGQGEGYLTWVGDWRDIRRTDLHLALRIPPDGPNQVKLILHRLLDEDFEYIIRWNDKSPDDHLADFYGIKGTYYDRLADQRLAGSGWFRAQADLAWEQVEAWEPGPFYQWDRDRNRLGLPNNNRSRDEYELFSSGRAVAENLRLDRELTTSLQVKRSIAIRNLLQLNVPEIDWAPRIEGLQPDFDYSSHYVPADQYFAVFPSLFALSTVIDEAQQSGTPVLNMMEPRSIDYGTRDFYLRQLCLDSLFDQAAKWDSSLGEIAITGSDPYFRTGTDVAVLFHTQGSKALIEAIRARQADHQANEINSFLDSGGWAFMQVSSDDRSICSYLLAMPELVIVSNSQAQLERLAKATENQIDSIADLPEYLYFRDRYPRKPQPTAKTGEVLEDSLPSAFVLLSDPAIRRWGSAKWRIGAARRNQAAALMIHELAGKIAGVSTELPDVSPYGTLRFQTPILELDITHVSDEEQRQYNRFIRRYQGAWREAFDPIAASLTIADGQLELDISIEPLVRDSDYWDFLAVTIGAELPEHAGDIHEEALLHWTMAINHDSEPMREWNGFTAGIIPGLNNTFDWVGNSLSLYIDDSPLWDELAEAEFPREFLSDQIYRVPFGLNVEVRDKLGLVTFLAGFRAFIARILADSPQWKNWKHRDVGYVEMTVGDDLRDGFDFTPRLFYVILPGKLVFSIREEVIHRAIDRSLDGDASKEFVEANPWLGKNMGLAVKQGVLDTAGLWMNSRFMEASWNNVPILNEWRRRYPDRDPVQVHFELWGERLLCPGGGEYRWNEELQTMESSFFGSSAYARNPHGFPPALNSIQNASFGLTFKDESLRARAKITR